MAISSSDDIDRGWAWVLLLAAYTGSIIGSTVFYMNGIVYLALLDTYNMDEAKAALIGSLSSAIGLLMEMTISRGDDIERGWAWVILLSVFVGNLIYSSTVYMNGIIYLALLDTYNMDEAKTSLIGSLNGALSLLMGPFVSIILNSFSCRVTILTGGLLVITGCACSAFVSRFEYLLITYGVVTGMGMALCNVPLPVALAFYFDKKRNLVIALNTAMKGVGLFIATPIALALWNHYGISGTFLIIGGISAQFIVIGIICRPSSVEKRIFNKRRADSKSNKQASVTSCKNKLTSSTYLVLFTNIPFILFLFSTVTWNALLAISMMHLPNYMSVHGAGSVEISAVMMCFGISNMSGRFLAAFTVARSRIDSLVLHTVVVTVSAVTTGTFPLYGVYKGTEYVLAALLGLTTGSPNGLMTPITLRMVGVDNISAAHGLEVFFCGVGTLAGPTVAAALYSHTGSYDNSFIFAGVVALIGSALAVLAAVALSRKMKSDGFTTRTGAQLDELQYDIDINVEPDKSRGANETLLNPFSAKLN